MTTDLITISKDPDVRVLKEFTVYDAEKAYWVADGVLRAERYPQGMNFMKSVVDFYNQKGFMSPRQYYVLVDILHKRIVTADIQDVPVPAVEAAFAKAIQDLDKKARVRIKGYMLKYVFSQKHQRGYVGVYSDEYGYVGKVQDGTYRAYGQAVAAGFDATDLIDMLTHFEEAVREYGHITNNCGVCRRKLTDPVSIARGIGPVCESRMGW